MKMYIPHIHIYITIYVCICRYRYVKLKTVHRQLCDQHILENMKNIEFLVHRKSIFLKYLYSKKIKTFPNYTLQCFTSKVSSCTMGVINSDYIHYYYYYDIIHKILPHTYYIQ